MRNVVVNEIEKWCESDSDVVVLTADLGYSVFEPLAERFPDRFINTGISEAVMTSVAAGLALSGKKVVTYSIGNFNTLRVMEQIRNDICYHNAHVVTIATAGGFAYGQLGMSHHATEDVAMMTTLPNMAVLVPATPTEARESIWWAAKHAGPSYLRLFRRGEPELYVSEAKEIEEPRCVSNPGGSSVAFLCSGPILENGMKAADLLVAEGIKVEVWSVPFVKPLKEVRILEILRRCSLVVTLEEHQIHGGLGGAVCELVASQRECKARVLRLGLKDVYTSVVGNHDYLCDYYGLSAEKIAVAVKAELD